MQGLVIENAFVDLGKCDFACPKCQAKHIYSDWGKKYEKQAGPENSFIVTIRCKSCRTSIEITVDMTSEVHIWLPEEN